MPDYCVQRELFVKRPREQVFEFFSRAANLEKITPPWLGFHILTPEPIEMRAGARIAYQIRVRGIPLKWLTEIERWDPPHEFVDIQLKGPYKVWHHTHRFFEVDGGTRIQDVVNYTLPLGPLGRLVHWLQVSKDIQKIFDHREQRVGELLG